MGDAVDRLRVALTRVVVPRHKRVVKGQVQDVETYTYNRSGILQRLPTSRGKGLSTEELEGTGNFPGIRAIREQESALKRLDAQIAAATDPDRRSQLYLERARQLEEGRVKVDRAIRKPRIEATEEGLFDVTGTPDLNPPDLPGRLPTSAPDYKSMDDQDLLDEWEKSEGQSQEVADEALERGLSLPRIAADEEVGDQPYPNSPDMQEAYDRLDIGNRDLDELENMRDNDPLDVTELEVVNNEISFLQEEEEGGGRLPTSKPGEFVTSRGNRPLAQPNPETVAKVKAQTSKLPARFRTFVDEAVAAEKRRGGRLPTEEMTPSGHRPLHRISDEIARDWKQPNFAAAPYLDAMRQLNDVRDMYGYDSATSIIAYFLSNASQWRGENAKRIKAELKAILKKAR